MAHQALLETFGVGRRVVLSLIREITVVYLILAFLVCLEADEGKTEFLEAAAKGLMWPVTLYKACKAYVKYLQA